MAKKKIDGGEGMASQAAPPDTVIVDEAGPVFEQESLMPPEELARFTAYIKGELETERDSEDRSKLLEKLKKWKRQATARPEQEIKDEPFPKSTNMAPPLAMSKINTIFGKTLAGFSLKRPFWDCMTNNRSLRLEAAAFARLMNAYANDPFSMNFKPTLRKMLYKTTRDGFQFYELSWANDTVTVIGEDRTRTETVVRSGPEVIAYPLEDVLINSTWTDIQKAPWIALGFTMTWPELMDKVASGRFSADAVEAVKPFRRSAVRPSEQSELDTRGLTSTPSDSDDVTATYDLWRFYAKWIIDGKPVDLVGVIHLESGQILYVETNKVGWRMVGKIGYFAIDESIYDIGVGHQCELLQEEVEMLHNLGGDAMKWNFLGMFKARNDAGIDTKTPAYPGRIWTLDNLDDLKEMKFEFDLTAPMARENLAMRYADMATGANQALSGQADSTLKSGGGAQAQQILMQSASTILDAEFDTMDESFGELGQLLAILIVKNAPFVPLETLVSAEDAALLKQFFETYSAADVVSQFRFVVKTTDIQRSETTKKETLALFSQLYTAYVNEVLALMGQKIQVAQNPALAAQAASILAFIDRAIAGKTELMKQIADFMHVGDVEKFFGEDEDGQGTGSSGSGTPVQMGPETQAGGAAGGGLPPGGPGSAGGSVPVGGGSVSGQAGGDQGAY